MGTSGRIDAVSSLVYVIMSNKICLVCEYCDSVFPVGGKNCEACGAPLPPDPPPAIKQAAIFPDVLKPTIASRDDLLKAQEIGKEVDKAASKAFYLYGLFW